jgi:ribonuclease R
VSRKTSGPLPSKDEIRAFIAESPTSVGKREIARAFGIRGADRIPLKAMIKELKAEGGVGQERRKLSVGGRLPEVAVVVISGTDEDGEVLARPHAWPETAPAPTILMAPERRGTPALEIGARVLARLKRIGDGRYEGRFIRRILNAPDRVVGVYRLTPEGGRLRPAERGSRTEYRVARADSAAAADGELVVADVLASARLGLPEARVVERLGSADDPGAFSLLAIRAHDIPMAFPEVALAESAAAKPVTRLGLREDLRSLPLVTIDGSDARDFDDAVFAEPDSDPANPGGFHLVVAIADVGCYVRAGSGLDRAAAERGNSVYFPDRVVPMLPEALSNELCSLKPEAVRPVMAVHLWIDAEGTRRRHRFIRGLMRSAARLTYEQMEAAGHGRPDKTLKPLVDSVVRPLFDAFRALDRARQRRGTLDLDLPERTVVLDDRGQVVAIRPRARLDSHRLIEEFMISANVAAAETLEAKRQLCMYRVHDRPDGERVEALRDFLDGLDLSLARGQVLQPRHFTRLLAQAADTPYASVINELVLRAQAKAEYSPENIGHFGLALPRYAHFTSPIRRYSDLLVHRGLIAALGLGDDGAAAGDLDGFRTTAQHISMTERRAQAAERDALDRFTARYLSARIGATFASRIIGVTRFGLFVRLEDIGADGLVPVSTLGADRFDHDERRHALVGRRSRTTYRLGAQVEVRLAEAHPIAGGLVFHLTDGGTTATHRRPQRRRRRD